MGRYQKSRFRTLVGLSLLVGPTWLVAPPQAQAQEPRYEKRTFTEWQKDLEAHSPSVRKKALEALSHLGPRAAPIVIQTLKGDADGEVRGLALGALLDIGSLTKEAVKAVLLAINDPNPFVQYAALEAAYAIAATNTEAGGPKIGPETTPALVEVLGDANPKVRLMATTLLASLGPAAKEGVPNLRELAERDPDARVQDAAKEALRIIEGR